MAISTVPAGWLAATCILIHAYCSQYFPEGVPSTIALRREGVSSGSSGSALYDAVAAAAAAGLGAGAGSGAGSGGRPTVHRSALLRASTEAMTRAGGGGMGSGGFSSSGFSSSGSSSGGGVGSGGGTATTTSIDAWLAAVNPSFATYAPALVCW